MSASPPVDVTPVVVKPIAKKLIIFDRSEPDIYDFCEENIITMLCKMLTREERDYLCDQVYTRKDKVVSAQFGVLIKSLLDFGKVLDKAIISSSSSSGTSSLKRSLDTSSSTQDSSKKLKAEATTI